MAIKSDVQVFLPVDVTDTVVLNPAGHRASVQKLTLHNTSDTDTVAIELFKSSDATSSAAERIWQGVLDPKESEWIAEGVTVIPIGEYLLAKADAGNGDKVNIDLVYKQLSGDD